MSTFRPPPSAAWLLTLSLVACGPGTSGPAVPAPTSQTAEPGNGAPPEHLTPDAPGTLAPSGLQFEYDSTPPTIVGFTPKNMSTGHSLTPLITVGFSEPMNKASVEAAFKVVAPANAAGSFTWYNNGRAVQFKPSQPFAYGSWVTWQMGAGATDLAGNKIAASSLFPTSFRVVRQKTVKIYSRPELDAGISLNVSGGKNGINKYADFADEEHPVGRDHWYDSDGYIWVDRNFYVFKLSDLPDLGTIRRVDAAFLHLYSTLKSGHPEDYGDLVLEQVNQPFQGILSALWNAPLVSGGQTFHLGDPRNLGAHSADITAQFENNVKHPGNFFGLSQWRARLEKDGEWHNAYSSDVFLTLGNHPTLKPYIEVTYEYP